MLSEHISNQAVHSVGCAVCTLHANLHEQPAMFGKASTMKGLGLEGGRVCGWGKGGVGGSRGVWGEQGVVGKQAAKGGHDEVWRRQPGLAKEMGSRLILRRQRAILTDSWPAKQCSM